VANDTFKFDRLGDLNPSMVEPDPFVPLTQPGQTGWDHVNLAFQNVYEQGARNDSQTEMDARVIAVVPNSPIYPRDYRPGQTDALNVGDAPYNFTLCYVMVPEDGDVFKMPPDLNRVRTTAAQGLTLTDKQRLSTFTRVYAPGDMTILPGDVVTINKSSQIVINNPERNQPRGPRPTPEAPPGSRQAFNNGTPAEEFPFPDLSDLERLAFEAKLYDKVYDSPLCTFFWADFVTTSAKFDIMNNPLDNTPSAMAQQNIIRLAKELDRLKLVSGPFTINSAFRSKEVNEHVTKTGPNYPDPITGKISTSPPVHASGLAADLAFHLAYSDEDRVRYFLELIPSVISSFDQMIIYEDTNHIHLSLDGHANRMNVHVAGGPVMVDGKKLHYPSWSKYEGRLRAYA